MKTVICLIPFSDGTLSMYKGEIASIDSTKATALIASGYVEEYVPDVPVVGTDDKDKYLHTNAETGAKEWATAGGSGGGVLVVHEVEEHGDTLLSGILPNVSGYAWRAELIPEHSVYYVDVAVELGDANIDDVYVLIGDMRFYNDDMTRLSYSNGVLSIKVGWSGQSSGYDVVTSESEIVGKNITVYANLVTRLDKTYKEITDAQFAILVNTTDAMTMNYYLAAYRYVNQKYMIAFCTIDLQSQMFMFNCDNENDYPVLIVHD